MYTTLHVFLIALTTFSLGLLVAWWALRRSRRPNIDAVEDAVYDAFVRSGLPPDRFAPDYNILALHGPRKVGEVYYHAARSLGQDHAWATVQDVIDACQEEG